MDKDVLGLLYEMLASLQIQVCIRRFIYPSQIPNLMSAITNNNYNIIVNNYYYLQILQLLFFFHVTCIVIVLTGDNK